MSIGIEEQIHSLRIDVLMNQRREGTSKLSQRIRRNSISVVM